MRMSETAPSPANSVAEEYAQSVLLLARATQVWEASVAFDPVDRRSVLINTDREGDHWLLTWLPGQATPWHDHGGSAGSFVVVRGRLCEQVARYRTSVDMDSPRVAPDSEKTFRAGHQVDFGTRHLHRLVNTGATPAVSLHVNAQRADRYERGDPDLDPEDELMTPAEVAAFFRVNPKTVTRWSASGKLSSVRTLGGHRRFLASEVHALRRREPG